MGIDSVVDMLVVAMVDLQISARTGGEWSQIDLTSVG